MVRNIYQKIVTWRRNLFLLPRGKCGVDFINELSRLINDFVHDTKWKRISLSMLHIFIPLMLQKPAPKSKAKDNAQYLTKRLNLWREGKLTEILQECEKLQSSLRQVDKVKEESCQKAFSRLMLMGKVGQAMKFINNDSDIKGVHELTRAVKGALENKHPPGKEAPVASKLTITTPGASIGHL